MRWVQVARWIVPSVTMARTSGVVFLRRGVTGRGLILPRWYLKKRHCLVAGCVTGGILNCLSNVPLSILTDQTINQQKVNDPHESLAGFQRTEAICVASRYSITLKFTVATSLVQFAGGSFFRMPGRRKSSGETVRLALMPPQPAHKNAGRDNRQNNLTVERTCAV